jgi:hypothetical protein
MIFLAGAIKTLDVSMCAIGLFFPKNLCDVEFLNLQMILILRKLLNVARYLSIANGPISLCMFQL